MRRLLGAVMLSASLIGNVQAAAVVGFEDLYEAATASCGGSDGATAQGCGIAVNAYLDALIAAGIQPEIAQASFVELRADITGASPGLAAEVAAGIDTVFDDILPETASTPNEASPS